MANTPTINSRRKGDLMASQEPQQIHGRFEEAFNAGDIDRLMQCYEPTAAFVPEPDKVVNGSDQIREQLQGLLALNGTIKLTTRQVIQADDVAFLSCDWTLNGTGSDGEALNLGGKTIEVVRRQADGTWRYLIDNPLAD